jgi:hypothetical protein
MSNKGTASPKKRGFLFNPLKRPLPYIGLILAILLIVFHQAIRDYTANVVGDSLLNIVKDETGGNYTVKSSVARFDIFTKELRLTDFHLDLDSTFITEEEFIRTHPTLIRVSTPLLVLKIHSWFDLIFNKELSINFIGVQNPRLIYEKNDHFQESDNVEKTDVLENLQSFLNTLEVDSFRVIDGYVELLTHTEGHVKEIDFKVNKFSAVLKNFKFNQTSARDLFAGLYADHVSIEIHDQEILLPDNEHKLNFKKLSLSTQKSEFTLDSLVVSTVEAEQSSGLSSNLISLPRFKITGLNFDHVYRHNELNIDSINIYKPVINMELSKLQLDDRSSNFTLDQILNGIKINSINLIDGSVDLDSEYPVHLGRINISLNNYRLDTLLLTTDNLLENLGDLKLDIKAVSLALPDSIHNLTIEDVTVDTGDSILYINNLKINPEVNRTRYSLLKQRSTSLVQRTSIREINLDGLNYRALLDLSRLDVDKISLTRPISYLLHYPSIKSNSTTTTRLTDFLIKVQEFSVTNGFLQLNQIQRGKQVKTILNSIYMHGGNITPLERIKHSETGFALHAAGLAYDDFAINVFNGSTHIESLGHTAEFSNLKIENNRDISIATLTFKPDSVDLPLSKYTVDAANIQIKGFDEESITRYNALFIDSVTVGEFSGTADLKPAESNSVSDQQVLEQAVIGYFGLGDGSISLKNKNMAVSVRNIFGEAYHLELDSLTNKTEPVFNFNDIYFQHGRFNFINRKTNFRVAGTSGRFSEGDSTIELNNIILRDTKKEFVGRISSVKMVGLDKQRLQKDQFLQFSEVFVRSPRFDIMLKSDTAKSRELVTHRQIQQSVLSSVTGIDFDSVTIDNGQITLKTTKNRNILLSGVNVAISEYHLDSLADPLDLFKPKRFEFNVNKLYTSGTKDTIEVAEIKLDLNHRSLYTGPLAITVDLGVNKLNVKAPSFEISGFTPLNFINNNYSLDKVRTFNAQIQLVQEQEIDTAQQRNQSNYYQIINSIFSNSITRKHGEIFKDSLNLNIAFDQIKFDSTGRSNIAQLLRPDIQTDSTALDEETLAAAESLSSSDTLDTDAGIVNKTLLSGLIRNIQIDSSVFDWAKNNDPNFPLRNTKFSLSVTNLELDSLSKIRIGDNIEDITLVIRDHYLNLPDSLNRLGVEEFRVSTGRRKIEVKNISLHSRVGKYEYAKHVGHQVTWQKLDGLNVSLDSIDIPAFLNEQAIVAHKLTVNGGKLTLFRDKQYEFPEDQRRAMPQDALRKINTLVTIDSVHINDLNVEYRERQQSDRKEGYITIDNITGRIGTITNDSVHIAYDNNIRATASCDLYNQGHITANFDFLSNDPDNRFVWSLTFTAMDAKEFNNILEETAYVSIVSGGIKSISLNAEADNTYATGKMRFLYNDLKVSTIKRKNMKTSGLGPGLMSFFANTFVVKKNNPNARVFVRTGDIYYERDERKVVFDYLVKTALSGVVSSIGARSNRKELKRIKKESKQKKDEEKERRKSQRKLKN